MNQRVITVPTMHEGEYLEVCPNCKCVFTYYSEHIQMHYPDVDTPGPITLQPFVVCPLCRQQRRLR